jgi:hypothetical protein
MITPAPTYGPIRGEEGIEAPRQNGSAMCCVMVMINAIAVVTIGLLGVAYWTTCMAMAPLNSLFNQDPRDSYRSQDKAYWCQHLDYYGYHKNNLTRCIEGLERAEKAEAHCWALGGRIYGLVAFAIFTGVVVATVGYCCSRKFLKQSTNSL